MACPACTYDLAPDGDRREHGHFAVRFNQWDRLVLKDNQPILDCYEVNIPAGQAWRYAQPLRLCECGKGAEAYIDTGNFTITTAAVRA